jgi:hypothetical protein
MKPKQQICNNFFLNIVDVLMVIPDTYILGVGGPDNMSFFLFHFFIPPYTQKFTRHGVEAFILFYPWSVALRGGS